MEKQQTAVDFYDQQLHILDLRLKSGSITIGEYFTLKAELFSQSKQMEKEQIKQDVYNVYKLILSNPIEKSGKTPTELFEIYYESKYGKDENKGD